MPTYTDLDYDFLAGNFIDLDVDTTNPRSAVLPRPNSENEKDNGLKVKSVDSMISKNCAEHHTDKYDLTKRESYPCLVLRRGQPFTLKITFNRNYSEKDTVSFVMTYYDAEKPNHGNSTYNVFHLKDKAVSSTAHWAAYMVKNEGSTITIEIMPPMDSLIGRWQLDIDALTDKTPSSHTLKTPIFVLFNAWCKDDQVYMESEEQRQEYVLADVGLIWKGVATSLEPTPWKFGQFDVDMLLSSIFVVQTAGNVPVSGMGNPVTIARALGAGVSSANNNFGVLEGRWTPTFPNGTSPHYWFGSPQILQKFYRTKLPVKYGQCWVFAGVLCTIARALGLPARVVTNYNSAHDTEGSLTLDYYVDSMGRVLQQHTRDSYWNFHVWNEIWMQRPDLGSSLLNGWQVVDATPQEQSQNLYRCGPCPVFAVKEGMVNRPYDCKFIFAEVNADILFWKFQGMNEPVKLMAKDVELIGKCVSTKKCGSYDRDDLTNNYKYAENTKNERDVTLKALELNSKYSTRLLVADSFSELTFNFVIKNDIRLGQPIPTVLKVSNTRADETYKMVVHLVLESITYMGKSAGTAHTLKLEKDMGPKAAEEFSMTVPFHKYVSVLTDQAAFRISCLCTIEKTSFEYYKQEEFRLIKPTIKITAPAKVPLGITMEASASFVNPMPKSLTGTFRIQAPGLPRQLLLKLNKEVPSGETASINFQLRPTCAEKSVIIANFSSPDLNEINGVFEFECV